MFRKKDEMTLIRLSSESREETHEKYDGEEGHKEKAILLGKRAAKQEANSRKQNLALQ